MDIKIINEKLQLDVYGFGATVLNKDYSGTAFKLSGKMWQVVKANAISNKGKNIWVYDNENKIFAGVELIEPATVNNYGLEKLAIHLEKYAYYKHIGPYQLIGQSGQKMKNEINSSGFKVLLPYIEIYGHWANDENKLETELMMCLK
jgi:hypothetical protein